MNISPEDIFRLCERLSIQLKSCLDEIQFLKKRISVLEEKLNVNSQNSSQPPSQDRYPSKPLKKKDQKEKKSNQTSRVGKSRPPFKEDQIDQKIDYYPEICPHCEGTNLKKGKVVEAIQKVDIPKLKLIVKSHRRIRCHCMGCGRAVSGRYSPLFSKKLLEPKLISWIGFLCSGFHISKRDVKSLLKDLFGLKVSLGTITNACRITSNSLKKPWEEAKAMMKQEAYIHADETGWFKNHKRHWLWVATNPDVTVFQIAETRCRKVAEDLLGGKIRTIITDRFSSYSRFEQRQYCWAHLKRDFLKISQRPGMDSWAGRALLKIESKVFKTYHKYLDGKITRAGFQRAIARLRKNLERCLYLIVETPEVEERTKGTCKNLLKHQSKLWRFVYQEGVSPTNNEAERAVRKGVIWRKLSHGTQSEWGNHFVERTLTIIQTLHSQRRDKLTFLEKAVKSYLSHQLPPALFPQAP